MKKQELNAKGMACPLPVIETKKLLEEYDVVETTVDNLIATQNLNKLADQQGHNIEIVEISPNAEYKVIISKKDSSDIQLSDDVIVNSTNDKCFVPIVRARRKLEESNVVEIIVNNKEDIQKLHDFANENNYKTTESKVENGYYIKIEKEEVVSTNNGQKDESYIVVINKSIMGNGSDELGSRLIKGFLHALSEQELLPTKIIFYNGGAILVDKTKSHVLDELRELEELGVEILCCGACIDYHNVELAVGTPTNMYFIAEDMRKANRIVNP